MLNRTLLIVVSLIISLSACSDEDDNGTTTPTEDNSGIFTASDQLVSQNKVIIDEITFENDGWVVIHADNGNGAPKTPGIISVPKQVSAGTQEDVEVKLDSNAELNGETKIWIMLHDDTGTKGEYEFDGQSGLDSPILNENEDIVMQQISIMPPSISDNIGDGFDGAERAIFIGKVTSAKEGWIVIHDEDEQGNLDPQNIIGMQRVSAGENNDLSIALDEDANVEVGQNLFPMLHINEPPLEDFDFPNGVDKPEVYGFNENGEPNIILRSYTIE